MPGPDCYKSHNNKYSGVQLAWVPGERQNGGAGQRCYWTILSFEVIYGAPTTGVYCNKCSVSFDLF